MRKKYPRKYSLTSGIEDLWDNPEDEIWDSIEGDGLDFWNSNWYWDGTTCFPMWLGDY